LLNMVYAFIWPLIMYFSQLVPNCLWGLAIHDVFQDIFNGLTQKMHYLTILVDPCNRIYHVWWWRLWSCAIYHVHHLLSKK
jgi:hypothetical protein